MLIISHRGNVNGPDKDRENTKGAILSALWQGFYCECDVWYKRGEFWLGHDAPTEKAGEVLDQEKVIFHCKNLEAVEHLDELGKHCFYHTKEEVVFTSRGWAWYYPSKKVWLGGVNVMPENNGVKKARLNGAFAVCTDYPEKFKIGVPL